MSIESLKSFINKMHLITSTIEILFNTLLCLFYDTNIIAWIFIQVILHLSLFERVHIFFRSRYIAENT